MANRNLKIFDKIIEHGRDRSGLSRLKRKQDREVFMQVYDRYVEDIYRFVYFKVNNEEEARDITSSIFLKAWNSIRDNKIDESKSLKAFLYTIARNTVIDYYRKSKPVSSIENSEEEMPDQFKDEAQDIKGDIEVKFDMALVYTKLDELKEEYKEIIILKYINELSLKEITRVTGKSKNNVRVISHRALKALRELMEEESKK